MKIDQVTSSTVAQLWATVEPRVRQARCLEGAAQALATALYLTFQDSVVLARVFVTVSFGELPAATAKFVRSLAGSAEARSALNATTPVLSLIGTHGEEEEWNDRRKSKGHAGIPLISSSFVEGIPMISRLLKELGVPLDWVDSRESEMIINTIGNVAGLFFVDRAATATDPLGRKIITTQDFVASHGVGSVFGTGGAYSRGDIVIIVVFCNDVVSRSVAESFVTLANLFVSNTTSLVAAKRIFASA